MEIAKETDGGAWHCTGDIYWRCSEVHLVQVRRWYFFVSICLTVILSGHSNRKKDADSISLERRTPAVITANEGYPSVRVYAFTKDSGALLLDSVEVFDYRDPNLGLSEAFV